MIISASYKTDIPTFYGEWFMNRLRAGYCKMVNPYGGQIYQVGLARDDVDGFVFWTENVGPFLRHLAEVKRLGYPFVVQHTINGYPRQLESRVIDYDRTVECMRTLRSQYGPKVAIWRYDPIIISSLTPLEWHEENFQKLAQALEGTTDEVVISFAQIYKKTKRNMDIAADASSFTWAEHERIAYPGDGDSRRAIALVIHLANVARRHGMKLTVCAQEAFVVPGIVEAAHCVEAERLAEIAGYPIDDKRQTGNRKECACSASRDIGEYDTCPHGCVYCYAVQNREKAVDRYKRHDPISEFLFPPEIHTIQIDRDKARKTPIAPVEPEPAAGPSGVQLPRKRRRDKAAK